MSTERPRRRRPRHVEYEDSPPRPGRAGSRNSGYWVLGIAIGACVLLGVVVPLGLVVALLLYQPAGAPPVELTVGSPYQNTLRDLIDAKREATAILQRTHDERSAERAVAELEAVTERVRTLNADLDRIANVPSETSEQRAEIGRQLGNEWNRATADLSDEWSRVRQLDGPADVLAPTMKELRGQLATFDSARRRLQGNDFVSRQATREGGSGPSPPAAAPSPTRFRPRTGRPDTPAAATAAEPSTPYDISHLPQPEREVLEQAARRFGERVPREHLALVRLEGSPTDVQAAKRRLAEICRGPTLGRNDLLVLGPVPDLEALARCIDFGTVRERDASANRLVVAVTPGWQFTPNQGPKLEGPGTRTLPPDPVLVPGQESPLNQGAGPHGGWFAQVTPNLRAEVLLFPQERSVILFYDQTGQPTALGTPRLAIETNQRLVTFRPDRVAGDPAGRSTRYRGGFASEILGDPDPELVIELGFREYRAPLGADRE